MNKKQAEVEAVKLEQEAKALGLLKKQYEQAAKDISEKITLSNGKINALLYNWDDLDDKEKSILQSQIYQRDFQSSLKRQIDGFLDKMNHSQHKTVDEYLGDCYKTGFIGSVYDLHGQKIPLVLPIDQKAMSRAVKLESKVSKKLYGKYVVQLRKEIQQEISRGIASALPYKDIARNLHARTNVSYNKTARIARTDGHRVQVESAFDAQHAAKEAGADIVKQWDATMDGVTRPNHKLLDGQIRELEEPFEVSGIKVMYPSAFGIAEEDIHCRCALLQRARWALGKTELQKLQEKAKYFGLDKSADFQDFQKKYLNATKPKKEYLTKKKIQDKLKDIEAQQYKLHESNPGWVQLEAEKQSLQEKLNKKLLAEKKKILKKQELLLQSQADNYEIKTYSGIWKNDVTTADWNLKSSSIQSKKSYFENKFIYAADTEEFDKWKKLIKQLDEFDAKGKEYYTIKSELKKTKSELNALKKGGIIDHKDAAYMQERKNAAHWFTDKKAADDALRPVSGRVWKQAKQAERKAAYAYTEGSGGFNRPLRGYQGSWYDYKGIGNVDLDYEGKAEAIKYLTDLIDKSKYDFDIWLQRGVETGKGAASFLDIPEEVLRNATQQELEEMLLKKVIKDEGFVSCGSAKGSGFNGYIFNIYCPEGTKMVYAEPFSAYGGGSKLSWNGESKQSYFGGEFETILQRGTKFRITKVERSGGNMYIDIEVVEQR